MLSGFLGAGEHGMQGLLSFYPEHCTKSTHRRWLRQRQKQKQMM